METRKSNQYLRLTIGVLSTLVAAGALLWFMKRPIFSFAPFSKDILNFYLNYELSTILVALALLVILYFLADRVRLSYLTLRNIKGVMHPSRLIGVSKPDRWEKSGWSIGLIITVVTGVVLYFQTRGLGYDFKLWPNLLMAIPLALANSFTEEVIFRLSFVTLGVNAGADAGAGGGGVDGVVGVVGVVGAGEGAGGGGGKGGGLNSAALYKATLFLGSVVFGVIHYWGAAPRGIFGSLLAAWIGYFLTKSMLETKGFFWAWLIHFAQDVVIMIFLFNTVSSPL